MAYGFKHEGYDLSGYDQDLVKQAQGGEAWGSADQARYDKLVSAKQKAKAQKSGATGQTENPIDRTQTGENDKVPQNQYITDAFSKGPGLGNPGAQDPRKLGSGGQRVNQDNDISTNVTGDKNTVINEQDNSVRNYGGSTRNFTYNSGEGENRYEDTPISAATMSGYYDVDDSPAAQAKFNSMYTTMNRDNQKRYAGEAMKSFAKYGNLDARSYTDESMENTINRGIQYSFDRSDRQTGHVFGDIWNDNYITEEWKMPKAPAAIESNAADIAKDAKKDIEDI